MDDFPPPPLTEELNEANVDNFPPPLPAVERSGVYVDYLPPSPPARVDLKGVQEDGFLPPSLPVELGNNVRSMNTSPTVGQYVDPTVSPPPPLPLAPSRIEWRG